jgi:hypothetical protein
MEKKAFMKTIEVVAAIILTTIFMLYIIPQYTGTDKDEQKIIVLAHLERDDGYRDFVLRRVGCFNASDEYLVNDKVESFLPEAYNYKLCINAVATGLPLQNIQLETQYISGNASVFKPKIVRLYYWID